MTSDRFRTVGVSRDGFEDVACRAPLVMPPSATVANRWFKTNRGLVLGLLTASIATGQLVFLPLLATSLVEAHGWRTVSATVACCAAAQVLQSRCCVTDLRDMDLPLYAGEAVEPRVALIVDPAVRALTALRDGMRSRDFWLLDGSFFVCGASSNGLVGTHLIPACVDHGIPEVRAAGLLTGMGIFDPFGRTGSGSLTDGVDSRKLMFA